jgi:hypothetical protein
MKIARANAAATQRGPADYFTGNVWLDEITPAPYASDVRVVAATFEPNARTALAYPPAWPIAANLVGRRAGAESRRERRGGVARGRYLV